MRIQAGLCVLAGVLLAGGCGRVDDTIDPPVERTLEPYEELAAASDTVREFRTSEGIGVVTVQGGEIVGGPLTATGNFIGTVEEAPPGAVTLTEVDEGTAVLISVLRFPAGTDLQATFVVGRCGEPGQVAHVVEPPIQVPPEGVANLETTAPVSMLTLLDGRHSIRLVHPQDAAATSQQPAMVRACADLPPFRGRNP
jgi:hypothetical protein